MLSLSWLKNKHFLVLLGNGMLSVIGLAITALLFNSPMSMDDIGMWFFVLSIIAFCEAVRGGFLSTAAVKFYAGVEPERGKTVLGSIWYLGILLTAAILLVNGMLYLLMHNSHNRELLLCIKWAGITFLCTLPSDIISWRLQADQKYNTLLWYRMIDGFASIICFAVLILFHEMTLEKALFFNFLTKLITSSLGILLNLGGLKTLANRTRECIIEIVHYGKYTLGSTSASILLGNVDTWMINSMLGPASVAIYNLSTRLMAIIELPLRSFATTGMSDMAVAYNRHNLKDVAYTFKKYSGMLTFAFIPFVVVAVLFGDFAIDLLGGAKFEQTEAANAFKFLMIISLIYPIERLNGITLDIIHKTKVNFYKVILMVTLKIIGDYIGLSAFGNIYGVVISIFTVHAVALFYGNYQLQKHLDYTIPGILTTGYTQIKALIKKLYNFRKAANGYLFFYIAYIPEYVPEYVLEF